MFTERLIGTHRIAITSSILPNLFSIWSRYLADTWQKYGQDGHFTIILFASALGITAEFKNAISTCHQWKFLESSSCFRLHYLALLPLYKLHHVYSFENHAYCSQKHCEVCEFSKTLCGSECFIACTVSSSRSVPRVLIHVEARKGMRKATEEWKGFRVAALRPLIQDFKARYATILDFTGYTTVFDSADVHKPFR